MKHASDMMVDQITIVWDGRPGSFLTRTQPVVFDDPEITRILRSFPMIGVWDDAFLMAECALDRMNCQMDLRGFAFPAADSIVEICDGAYEYIAMSEAAFRRLLLRLFEVLIGGAEQSGASILRDEHWSQFTAHVARLQASISQ